MRAQQLATSTESCCIKILAKSRTELYFVQRNTWTNEIPSVQQSHGVPCMDLEVELVMDMLDHPRYIGADQQG